MPLLFEELRVLQAAEKIADAVWSEVNTWEPFARDTIGKQMVRAIDSIGANIAEAYGRYHYGERLRFFYYARGSLYETKYWLNRTKTRGLATEQQIQIYIEQISGLAHQLNTVIMITKQQRHSESTNQIRENQAAYRLEDDNPHPLFTPEDLNWLQSSP